MRMAPVPEHPDIEDNKKSLDRLHVIFQEAAEKCTGPGKPKFQRLSRAFNSLQAAANAGDRTIFAYADIEFKSAMEDVQKFSRTDSETADILFDMSKAITQEEQEATAPPAAKKPKKHWKI